MNRLLSVGIRRIPFLWQLILNVAFAAYCLRFQHAAFLAKYSEVLPTAILSLGAIISGWLFSAEGFFALLIALPLLTGAGIIGLINCIDTPSIVFSGMFLGQLARFFNDAKRKHRAKTVDEVPIDGMAFRYFFPQEKVLLAVDLLTSAILLSVVVQMAKNYSAADFWQKIWRESSFSLSDPFYFIRAGFIWLEGLFLFKIIMTMQRPTPVSWVLLAHIIVIPIFTSLQLSQNIPLWADTYSYYSPFEDMSAFGGAAAAILAYIIGSWRSRTLTEVVVRTALSSAATGLAILSYVRSAWLAASVSLLFCIFFRAPKKTKLFALLLVIAAVLFLDSNFARERWSDNPYYDRLHRLVGIEPLKNKEPSRVELYQKAVNMVLDRPIFGHGIGMYYLTLKTGKFSKPGDIYPPGNGEQTHNVILQLGAEMGIPVTSIFCALLCAAFYRGVRSSLVGDWESLGISAALLAYLINAMFSTVFNLYAVSHFFFWLLIAGLFRRPAIAKRSVPVPKVDPAII